MIKTIIEKSTGKVLYATIIEGLEITDQEVEIDEILSDNFENPHYDFETKSFYNKIEA